MFEKNINFNKHEVNDIKWVNIESFNNFLEHK